MSAAKVIGEFATVLACVAAFFAALVATKRLMDWGWGPHPYLRQFRVWAGMSHEAPR